MAEGNTIVRAPRVRRGRADLKSDRKLPEPTQAELSALSPDDRATYVKQKKAMDAYRDFGVGKDIKDQYGLNISFVARLSKRAEELDPVTRQPRGYYVCVPKTRERGARHGRESPFDPELARSGKGLKGVLGEFFRQHADIETALKTFLRTRRTALLSAPTVPVAAPEPCVTAASCFKVFQFYCRQKGLDKRTTAWPYVCHNQGEGALRAYYAKWKAANPKLAAFNELGTAAAQEYDVDAAVAKNQVAQAVEALLPAYGRLELDGHLLHSIGTVVFKNKAGIPVHVEVRRLYALVARDARTPTIFACRLCFGLRYDTNDVLAVLRDVLFPPPRRKLTLDNPEFRYRDGAGFPGEEGVMPVLWGNTFQELAWDADSAHVSAGDTQVIEDLLKCKVAGERIGSPTARTFIEGLNRFLASAFQVLATGTGKNHLDAARRNPEEAAVKYTVTIELLEELLDVWVRNWNATFRPEFGDTPLGGLKKLADQGEVFLSRLGELSGEDRRHEFFPRFRRELQFSRTTHGVLLVNLYGARYSSRELASNAALNAARNRWCTLYVNEQDARKGFVVPDEYPQLRIPVFVQNRALSQFPHPLQWRRVTCWWGIVHGRFDKAVTPDTMRAAALSLGEKAQTGEPTARAALSSAIGEQARVESGAISNIDSDTDWESVQQPVTDAGEAEEAVVDPEFAPTLSTSALPSAPGASEAPRKRRGRPRRAEAPSQPPQAAVAARSNFNPFSSTSGNPPLPACRRDALGLGL